MSFLKLDSRGNLALIQVVFLAITLLAPIQLVGKVQAPTEPWWNTDWQYRKMITINHLKVAADLTYFPVLISLTDTDLASKTQTNGYDIVFIDDSGSKLAHEIESFNRGAGTLIAWVNVPSLSSISDTILYIYYGNPSATNQQDVTGTWDANYAMVTHLKEATGTLHDSTSYNNDGTANGVVQGVTGKIDGAASFSGASSYIECANHASLNPTRVTLKAWIKPATISGTRPIVEKYDYLAGKGSYLIRQVDNDILFDLLIGTADHLVWANDVLQIGNWYYVVGTFDGSSLKVYVNDNTPVQSSWTGNIISSDQTLKIGTRGNDKTPTSFFFNGIIDEVTVSSLARSANWISTEYNNQNSPSTFYNVESEEELQGPPTVSNPSPANGTIDVSVSLSKLSFDLNDAQNDPIDYEVTTSPNIGSGSGTGVANGRPDVTVSGLQYNTVYTWRVCTRDLTGSGRWNNVTYRFKTWAGPTGSSWLSGWRYRKSHVITSATGAGTGYQTMIKVSFSALAPASWFTVLPTNIPVFMTTDVSSNGTVFAGDRNYNIYKSTDSGVTFTKIFTIPAQPGAWGVHAGRVWTVFVDSRDNLLVSAGGTNRIYRCLNGSTSFTQVLDMSRGSNDGMIISMTEDDSGNLYAAEYGDGMPARLWKSINNGTDWSSLRDWSARHLHAVKFNPSNKWLYVVVGEEKDGSQTEYQTVWRSKDGGNTWYMIIARSAQYTQTKYLPIEFIGNDVYLGQDRNGASDTDNIHRITDNGTITNLPFSTTVAYANPYVAAIMTSATKLNDTIIFTTSSETTTATCQVVMSKDGVNWTVLNAQPVSTAYTWINELTVHPRKGIVYGCINNNYCYYIASPSTPRPPPLQLPLSAETVLAEGHCKTDFGDIRFTDDDGTNLLDYWMETKVDGEYATFWVKVADDLTSVSRTIYVYYGKSDATTTGNPDNTFLFFDGFNGDLSKWTALSGTWTTGGGNLTIQPSTVRNNYLITQSTFATSNIAIRTKIASTQTSPTPYQAHPGVIWHANTLTGTSHRNDQVYFRPHATGPTELYGNIQPAYYDGIDGIDNSGLHFYDDKKGSYYNWNTWYTVEVRIPFPPMNLTLYANNLYWHNWGNQQYSNDRIGLVAQEGGKNYFDYFAVRKYVDPEPAHSTWGSEETLIINSCSSAGTKKDDFDAAEGIWVNGSKGYSPSTTYPIFVVTDIDWDNDDPIPTRVEGTVLTVTSNPDGSILAKVWDSARPGKYDIVIDFDGDGVYDEGIDPLDNNQVVETAGFFVIPEYALGTILALVVCFASVGAYRRIKRSKR